MSAPFKIPADVERPDRVLAGLTARQVCLLAVTAAAIYGGGWATRTVVPLGVYLIAVIPVAAGGAVLALGRRDGVGLDEYLRAALAYRLTPRLHHNPDSFAAHRDAAARRDGNGVPRWLAVRAHHSHRPPRSAPFTEATMPARAITAPTYGPADVGLLDLGSHGVAVIAACSTVNFALRTDSEQGGLIECFARLLHAQTGPLQILVRSHPIDLTPTLAQLTHATTTLGHPALRTAAAAHHRWLTELAATEGLLARQILLVLREPTNPARAQAGAGGGRGPDAAAARLIQRLGEARRALAPADITMTPLSPSEIATVLATSTDPSRHLPSTPRTHPNLAVGPNNRVDAR